MHKDRKKAYKLGFWAEQLASVILLFKGYRILEKRYKTPVGEIDIIACKQNTLVFVEVKMRKTKEMAFESVTPRMKDRISRAAQFYLSSQKHVHNPDIRFDMMAITPPFFWQHLDNAWMISA